MEWQSVIGLEIHVQLSTKSKLFSGASTQYGAEPNTQTCQIDLGLPGVLPVVNEESVRLAAILGHGINATVAPYSAFDRKNYFYPDSPKGYQTSQFAYPIVHDGYIDIQSTSGETLRVTIIRAHLEEDAGKSVHEGQKGYTGIDLNRAGTPLLEIVTAPDIRNAKDAVEVMRQLHMLVRYLQVSDGNMQEGSFRCDANISVMPKGASEYGTRAEIKNLNSFRFVEKAINYEIERQIDVIESGGTVVQETRLYDSENDETRSMRGKEEANDYRYFPCPDLCPIVLSPEWIESIRQQMPVLPAEKANDYISNYSLSDEDALQIAQSRETSKFFEAMMAILPSDAGKIAANWLQGEMAAMLNKEDIGIEESKISSDALVLLIERIRDNTISSKMAKGVFEAIWNGEGTADEVIAARGLKQISDTSVIETAVDDIMAANMPQVEQYRAGKDKVKGFFVGQIMKQFKGQANPAVVDQIVTTKLKGE
jgi:aspartyl-tRNA(Asn)/glutamyl-tRNA(Gln) amidotransferase subunit B